ncbi:MAG TPA: Ni-sirohydrochlorin a,c-diamide synthase [Methanoregulaceae archaeon]|nr:Ni-sirohydrochlorin a,c-diamide synthase [Methanoregulaceae archaeon]
MKGVLISGDRSGCGKTSVTLALSALLARDRVVQTFKVGMDYIDPSYLTAVTGRPCRNLDAFVLSPEENREIFRAANRGAGIAIVEGVRGLYEGAEAIGDAGSTAEIAKLLDLPVVLVVNARSVTRSAAALIRGFQAFDPAVRIAGVILNNVSGPSHREKATRAIEHFCRVPVLGAVPPLEEMQLAMRHLGLVPYREGSEMAGFRERVGLVTRLIGEYVPPRELLAVARELPEPGDAPLLPERDGSPDVQIGLAHDEAFNFYYADLEEVLASAGAGVVRFSPCHDRLPDADGYILGGGYPEIHAARLEENGACREGLREAARNGVPVYGECGGLIYLTDRIRLAAGWRGAPEEGVFDLAGILPGEARMPARRVVTYVQGEAFDPSPMGAGSFKGHSFHYSGVELEPGTRYAYTLVRGVGIDGMRDGAVAGNTLGTYCHVHPVGSRRMFGTFVERCRAARNRA